MLDPKTENSLQPIAASDIRPSGSGFKGFNAVGREDIAAEVLRPQVDRAARQRAILLIGVVLVLLLVVGYIAYTRSHLSLTPTNENGPHFQSGPQSVD
jgi:hypothetical protein